MPRVIKNWYAVAYCRGIR